VRWVVIIYLFLGNGSVNTFPRKRLRMELGKRGVAYAVRAEELLVKEENWGNQFS
jgi:hypothetical protein